MMHQRYDAQISDMMHGMQHRSNDEKVFAAGSDATDADETRSDETRSDEVGRDDTCSDATDAGERMAVVSSAKGFSTEANFLRIKESEIHRSYVFDLVSSVFVAPDGQHLQRDIVRHPGAVAVVAVDRNSNQVVMVRQFRPPVDHQVLEIPAGRLDPDDDSPALAAERELAEETGLACGPLVKLGSFLNSPGFTDELTHIFLTDAFHNVEAKRDEGEEQWMTVEWISLDDVLPMIERGEINDVKSVIGLLLTVHRLGNSS